jgi:hypothetical protein
MHPNVLRALEEIDAAVFNGDTFDKAPAQRILSRYTKRWARKIGDAIADVGVDDGHRLAMAALRAACDCDKRENPPCNWNEGHARIPHHCDCPMYPIELPDEEESPSAHADATKKRKELLR